MKTSWDTVSGLKLPRVLEPDHSRLLCTLSALSGSKNARKFPGPNPCSLERSDFPKLRQQPYFLAEKTDGVRFLWLCCTFNTLNVSAIVDRSMAAYLLPLHAVPTAMFQGSVVDCELAFNKVENTWHLMAFDAYVVSGVPVFNLPFSHRLAALQRAMTVYEACASDPLSVRVKRFFPTCMFRDFLGHMHEVERYFAVDGIILTPELSHASIGRHTELFKLKTKHSVDFLVGPGPCDLGVFLPSARDHVVVAGLREPLAPGCIAECVSSPDGVWDLVCVRTDKSTANDMLTYEKTLLNAREGITIDEVHRVVTG